jgi:indole-3-glycerol phosphate synthase
VILDDILTRTRVDLAVRREERPLADLEARARRARPARSLAAALRRPGRLACIAEVKRRSPSAGWIRQDADAAAVATAYAGAGADAISVLTDTPFFGGSLADLEAVRAAVDVPLLRKDFVVDAYQLVEARAAGADAVLLIAAALPEAALADLLAAAGAWGLEALVETHDEAEVDRAVRLGARVIGINHRDLRTFAVDRGLAARLRPRIPPDRAVVAESGIRGPADLGEIRAAGVNAVLVGETLMRAPDPGVALREIRS